MKRINAFLLGISIAAIVSCDNNEEGGLTPIVPEQTEFTLDSKAASFTVSTKESGWFLHEIKETTIYGSQFIRNETQLIDGVNIPLDTMSGEWYEVIKSKPKEVTFHIAENTTQETRQLILTITGIGMSYDDITITQE